MEENGIKGKVLDYLSRTRIGASASDIAKNIRHNRVTVSKYLEIMKAHGLIDFMGVAQAKLWFPVKVAEKPSILIVDDEKHIVDLIALSLIPNQYQIMKAGSGTQALELVTKQAPDLVLLDVMMPGMTGYEVCARMKDNPLTQHIPIIMLTAKGELKDKLQGLKIGADDYITKPFDPMELEARVERMLRRVSLDIDTHPLSKLPGSNSVKERLQDEIARGQDFIVCNISFPNLKEFCRTVGYRRSSQAVTIIARAFADATKDGELVGHTTDDRFIVICKDMAFIEKLQESFGKMVPLLCPDRQHLNLSTNHVTGVDIRKQKMSADGVLAILGVG
jgi:DNA-binding response OmpR family regulator